MPSRRLRPNELLIPSSNPSGHCRRGVLLASHIGMGTRLLHLLRSIIYISTSSPLCATLSEPAPSRSPPFPAAAAPKPKALWMPAANTGLSLHLLKKSAIGIGPSLSLKRYETPKAVFLHKRRPATIAPFDPRICSANFMQSTAPKQSDPIFQAM